ncbi:hypothetical protein ACFOGJ_09045 [Marinibaculum pumilum]|uniref:Uncharacterized protein n=1 Tax=Marinibaculum pumilum TaxID=1766165 RepID=A0ABV7KYJ3_9PROT
MTTTADDYSWWRDALAGKAPKIHDSDPQAGFYRQRRKDSTYVPVAIWWATGVDGGREAVCLSGVGDDARRIDAAEAWTFVAQNPVTEKVYRRAFEGHGWPDMDNAAAPPTAGHNQPPPADDAAAIREQIDAAAAGVPKYATIADDEHAAAAQSLRARLNELSREADKLRTAEKAPHLEAGKAVDAKWQPIVKDAKAHADTLAKNLSAYETAKARAAEKARREAEEARRKAEEEARKAAEPNSGPAMEVQSVYVPPEPEPAPVQTTIKGGYGRAASVKVIKVATVVDQDKAYMAMRTHPELRDLISRLAQRAVAAGHTIDGVEVSEERKVA